MSSLTISKAKKVLGSMSEGMSDDEIEKTIKAAELLFSIYSKFRMSQKKKHNFENYE